MALIPGKQIEVTPNGIATANLNDGVLSADAAGRLKMATGYFDLTTVGLKFSAASIALSKLEEAVIQADGGQAFTADQSMGGFKLTSLANGTAASDAVNYGQLQGLQAGLSWKQAVKAATTAALPSVTYANGASGVGATLTATANGALATQDGITLTTLDRLLVKDQASGLQNGIYEVTTVGDGSTAFVLTRVTDCDISTEIDSAAIFVQQGSAHGDTGWTQTTSAPTMGTTALVWTQFNGMAGITYGTPGSIQPDDSASAGVATTVSRSDHRHAIVADVPVGLGTSNTEGSSTSFSRADHVHARDVQRQESVTTQTITGTDTALTDVLDATPLTNASVQLYLNGLLQRQGATRDYTLSGTTITWLASSGTAVDLATTDELLAVYSSAT